MNWEKMGVNINGEYFNNLQFSDGILLLSESEDKLEKMKNYLNRKSLNVGFTRNKNKRNLMYNCNIPKWIIIPGNEELEYVLKYINLEQERTFNKDHENEIKQCLTISWTAFNKIRDIMKKILPICLNHKVYNAN